MTVLLIAEMSERALAVDITAKAANAAGSLGEVTLLCFGEGAAFAAEEAAAIAGIARVLFTEDARYRHRLCEPSAALIAALARRFDHIVAAASADGKNLLPRVAALLDCMIISDVSAIVGPEEFERPVYAGNAIQTVRSRDPHKVLTVRTASFEAAAMDNQATVEPIDPVDDPQRSEWIENQFGHLDRPELTSASAIVSGGRGLGSKDEFALIEKLADKLGAAVGASRAAVDAGYAPNDWQVGQTGKVVAPDLYVAVGISGAIQHLAGMKDSRVIVAINNDEEAPIFNIADVGLVADLFEAVPELLKRL